MFPPDAPTSSFPYRVEGQVGVGSMGVVYRATEVDLERTVAIKVLRQSVLDEEPVDVRHELQRRFLQEARAAAVLSHPGVTTVYRVGTEEGVPFMVMEWLEGQTLEEVLRERERFEIGEAARLMVALLETLAAAHRGGVVHRDIKPSNLVLLEDGRLKVTDFGIALLQGRELVRTQAGVVLATPKFASPEQLRGIAVDGRADIFSSGILFYHMITGQFPFEGRGFMELANAILQTEPRPIRDLRGDVPPAIERVLRTALEKDRNDRYPDAQSMAEDLMPFVTGEATGENPLSGYVPVVGAAPRADEATIRLEPVHRDLGPDPMLALVEVVTAWPSQNLATQSTEQLLARLLEKPLHTAAFSGAAMIGPACLLICDGQLVGALDTRDGAQGDAVAEGLPTEAPARLHPTPQGLSARLVSTLASVLHPPMVRHADLDSSFVNLPALGQKLREDRFNGLMRLRHGEGWALILFIEGQNALSLYSRGWEGIPVEQSWQRWVGDVVVRASVEEKVVRPLSSWYRLTFRNFELQARPVEKGSGTAPANRSASSSRIRQIFSSGRTSPISTGRLVLRLSPGRSAPLSGPTHYEEAPAYHFLSWALQALPPFFAERDKSSSWKYLSEWIPKVRRAQLYHDLPRPESRESDFFDLVTTDDAGKVLHLGQRFAKPTPKHFEACLERVVAAKTARIKTGDVGGVFFVAPSFPENVLQAYAERIQGGSESFTGYAGFVRIGARRGFHLLLVEERDDAYSPLLVG